MHAHRKRLTPLVLALAVFTSGCGYNRIQTLDEATTKAKQQIAVQLQRRAELIPNLVEVVKGYAAHEAGVFESVAEARAKLAGAATSGDVGQMAAASQQMTGALGRLLAISENYPQLKANESFIRLHDDISGTENRVAVARTDYNTAVNEYNTYIRRFPQVLTAKVMGMQAREYFEISSPAAAEAPKVNFAPPAGKVP